MNYLQKELYDLIKSDDLIFDFIQESSSIDGLWYWDLENPEEEWMNPKFWTILGYDPAEMPHKTAAWQNIINQEDLQLAILNLTQHIQDHKHPYDQIVRYRHKEGHTIWIRCRGLAVRDAEGKAIRVLGAHHDITAQKEAEQQAFKDAELYKTILNNQSAYILKLDREGNYTYLNEMYCKDFEWATQDSIGTTSALGTHPDDIPKAIEVGMLAFENPQNTYKEILRKIAPDGSIRITEWEFKALTNTEGYATELLCIGIDITEKYSAEEAIKKSEHSLKEAQRLTKIGSWEFDLQNNDLIWSEEHYRIFEIETTIPKEKLYEAYRSKIHPEDLKELDNVVSETIPQGKGFVYEHRALSSDGSIKYVLGKGECIFDEKGIPIGSRGTAQDITDQKKIELELIEKNQHIQAIYNALDQSNIVSIIDKNGIIQKVNQKYLDVAQYSEEELIGKERSITDSDYHPKSFWTDMWETINTGKVWRAEVKKRAKDGSHYWVDFVINPIYDTNQNITEFISIQNLITDKKEAEVKLHQVTNLLNDAQRIANVGGWELDLSTGETLWTDEVYVIHELEKGFDHNKVNGIEFYHPDYQEIITNAITHTIQTQEPFDEICRFITAKGNHRWVRASGQAIEEDGKVTKLVGMFQDISKEKEAEQNLIRTQKMLEQTNKVAQIGGWEFDLESNQIYWSDMLYHIHELPTNTPLSLEMIFSFYEKESKETLQEAYQKAIQKEGEGYDLELEIITDKGNSICVRAIGRTEFKEGKCTKVYGTFQDISSQKQAQKEINIQKELLDTIITDLQEGLALVNPEGVKVKVNKAFCQMTGYSEEELIGESAPFSYWPEDNINEIQDIFQKALSDNIAESLELTLKRKNGELFPAIIKPKSVKNAEGEVIYAFTTVRDISNQRQYENNILEAKKNAEAASKAKSEFLANMSHEIRTPLNGVIGFADLLMKTQLDPHQQEYMQTVFQSANSLLDIINDILDFSKIEAGKLELSITKTDLLELTGQIADMIKHQVHKKGIEMLLNIPNQVPRFIWTDAVRLRQILVNLLGNAIKFTEKGEIELKIEVLEDINSNETKFLFSIIDTGIGIDPKNQQKIFEAFSQEDASTTRRFGGTGLGLSISNKLLNLMGTHLQLKSTPNKGSNFFFEICLYTEKGEAQSWNSLQEINKILVVDDNENNRNIVQKMLSKFEMEVQSTKNGMDTLEKLQAGERYDVILMDYDMPFMNGLATLKNIRKELNISAEEQPVIFLHSSFEDKTLLDDFKKWGATQVITKPIHINTLYKALYKLKNPEVDNLPQDKENPNKKSSDKLTVLIADDNNINLLLAKSLIEYLLEDVTIIQAHNGQEAINMFELHHPKLILMDIQMPNINGYEATKAIRKLSGGKEAIIIALTAGTVKGEKERCLIAGMNDYLSKPIVSEKLDKVLNYWLYKEEMKPNLHNQEFNNLEGLAHFDVDLLKQRIYNDESVFKLILQEAEQYLSTILPVFYQSVKLKDLNEIRSTAHRLKGSSSSACFMRLTLLASQLELLTEFQENIIYELLDNIKAEIFIIRELIKVELTKN